MVTITLLAEHGCLSSGICGTVDAFSIAEILRQFMGNDTGLPLFKTQIVTVDGKAIRANAGILIQPDCAIADVGDTTLIVVPASYPPFDLESQRAEAINKWLRKRHEGGAMMRIEKAKQHLETTEDSVSEITWRMGYEDINAFRRIFKKHTGLSPREYRNKFGCRPQERV